MKKALAEVIPRPCGELKKRADYPIEGYTHRFCLKCNREFWAYNKVIRICEACLVRVERNKGGISDE